MSKKMEYRSGGLGAEFVRAQVENSVGKTIERIRFGPSPSCRPRREHRGASALHLRPDRLVGSGKSQSYSSCINAHQPLKVPAEIAAVST